MQKVSAVSCEAGGVWGGPKRLIYNLFDLEGIKLGAPSAILDGFRFMLPYRRWKYNEEVDEFFVEDDTVVKLKKADVYRETHTTEMDESCLRHVYFENRSIYIHLKIYISTEIS